MRHLTQRRQLLNEDFATIRIETQDAWPHIAATILGAIGLAGEAQVLHPADHMRVASNVTIISHGN
jgi:hypothetical protein